jgi:hypothetical protein
MNILLLMDRLFKQHVSDVLQIFVVLLSVFVVKKFQVKSMVFGYISILLLFLSFILILLFNDFIAGKVMEYVFIFWIIGAVKLFAENLKQK